MATVSTDKKILLYKGDTLDLIKEVGTHEMSGMSVAWIDDANFATCSNDKTIKFWNVDTGLVKTLKTKEKPEINDF